MDGVNERELKQQSLTLIQRAAAIVIKDQPSYDEACAIIKQDIKPLRAKWEGYWYGTDAKPGPLKLAHMAYKASLEKFNEADKPLEEREKALASQVRQWEAKQAQIREEKQRQAQLAEEKRLREERERDAEYAELAGAPPEQIEAMVSEPVVVVAAPVAPTYNRNSGVVRKLRLKARITDLKKLCAAIGKGLCPTSYVEPNMTALNARANADGLVMSIPGVEAYDPNLTGGK